MEQKGRILSEDLHYSFVVFIIVGFAIAWCPWISLFILVISAMITLLILSTDFRSLNLWQKLTLFTLTGYIVLNYGFTNLAFRFGNIPMPIIVGYFLGFTALALALLSSQSYIRNLLREPVVRWLGVLLILSFFHLVVDVPRYGLYALRDSTLIIEGLFLLLGLLWARDQRRTESFIKFLAILLVINLIYTFSYPWSEWIRNWSPKSGIFLTVPVFGSYAQSYLYLAAGALFFIFVAKYWMSWPHWVLVLLGVFQLLGIAVLQARSMYIGLLLCFLMLIMLGEGRKVIKTTAVVVLSIVVLGLFTSLVSFELQGRIGPVRLDFLWEHFRSLLLKRGAPAIGTIYHRFEWYSNVLRRVQRSTLNFLVGEGFGQPLIDFTIRGGIQVRQPHNTHLSVLARLGLVGLAFWAMFHFSIVFRFIRTLHKRHILSPRTSNLVLWLFLYYILVLVTTTVQPLLEFSYGAIPFYFMMGLALGIMWRETDEKNNLDHDALKI